MRLSYRYPVAGIPGARARSDNPVRQADHAELCVLALRLWLAQAYRRQRHDYARWQAGSGWPAPSRFDQHGGFAALRARARDENAAEQHAHGTPVTDATRLRAERLRNRLAVDGAPVTFADAVGRVLGQFKVPMTFLDADLDAGATFNPEVPGDHAVAVHVREGSVRVGAEGTVVGPRQTAWFDPEQVGATGIVIAAEPAASVVVYSGRPVGRVRRRRRPVPHEHAPGERAGHGRVPGRPVRPHPQRPDAHRRRHAPLSATSLPDANP